MVGQDRIERPVAQIPFAQIIKNGYKNSNKFLERNCHDGLSTRYSAKAILSFHKPR
jgi:hypothetical protein